MSYSLDANNADDAAVAVRLREVLGDEFALRVSQDAAWAKEILGTTSSST